jgi:hypothetical protein
VSDEPGSIAYIIQERVGSQLYLCVMNDKFGGFHRFPLTVLNASRLASECAWAVNGALGGYNPPLAPRADVAQTVVE